MTQATILLVDDDQGMIELLAMRISAMGYLTRSADNGRDALQMIEQQRPELVITDLRMDEMDGLTLFDNIHQHWPSLPVVVLTAHGTIPEAVAATQRGVFSFLTKPVDKSELQAIIQQALKQYPESGANPDSWQQTIKTRSSAMLHVLEQAQLLASSDVNILITGQSGTGKELMARALHQHSHRADQPFVALNCSAIPGEMLESELFGHVKGAFTGATRDHEGLITAANGGVLFLDEIGDMPLALQAKLLRVLQERRVRQVGNTKDMAVDIRFLAATHRNLLDAINENQFREDLYYRLNVVNLHLPGLQERREDIVFLAYHFLEKIAQRSNRDTKKISPQAAELLMSYHWPGNVRQLENVMEQVVALSRGPVISETLIANAIPEGQTTTIQPLTDAKRDFEREYVTQLLQATEGNVALAAKLAGRNRSDFYKILQRHNIEVDRFKETTE